MTARRPSYATPADLLNHLADVLNEDSRQNPVDRIPLRVMALVREAIRRANAEADAKAAEADERTKAALRDMDERIDRMIAMLRARNDNIAKEAAE